MGIQNGYASIASTDLRINCFCMIELAVKCLSHVPSVRGVTTSPRLSWLFFMGGGGVAVREYVTVFAVYWCRGTRTPPLRKCRLPPISGGQRM